MAWLSYAYLWYPRRQGIPSHAPFQAAFHSEICEGMARYILGSLPHLSKLRLDQCLTTYYYFDSLTPLPISPLGAKLNCSLPPFILRSDAGHRARDPPPRAHFLWLWATKSNYNLRFFTTRCVHCILIWDIHVPLHRYFITPNLGLPSIRTLRSALLTMDNGFHVFVVSCG